MALPFLIPSSSKDFSKADMAGRYSPDPTNANDPFMEPVYVEKSEKFCECFWETLTGAGLFKYCDGTFRRETGLAK